MFSMEMGWFNMFKCERVLIEDAIRREVIIR